MTAEIGPSTGEYRARDGFLGSDVEPITKDDGAPTDWIPYNEFGPSTQRTELRFDDVFPRRVAQTALIGDSPSPVEPEPQRRGRQDGPAVAGQRAESWSTGVGSIQRSTTGDWFGKASTDDERRPMVVAASEAPRRMLALPIITETQKAGDAAPPATGDWIARGEGTELGTVARTWSAKVKKTDGWLDAPDAPIEKYSDDQERDDHGRFSGGGTASYTHTGGEKAPAAHDSGYRYVSNDPKSIKDHLSSFKSNGDGLYAHLTGHHGLGANGGFNDQKETHALTHGDTGKGHTEFPKTNAPTGGGKSGNDKMVHSDALPYEHHLMAQHGQTSGDINHIMDEVMGGTESFHALAHAEHGSKALNADHTHPVTGKPAFRVSRG